MTDRSPQPPDAAVFYADDVTEGDYVRCEVFADQVWALVDGIDALMTGQQPVLNFRLWVMSVDDDGAAFSHTKIHYPEDYVIVRRRDIQGPPA